MKIIYTIIFSVFVLQSIAQNSETDVTIYYSHQSGKSTTHNGTYHKKTDSREHGTVKFTTTGPVKYRISPSDLSIEPNQEKTWTGTILADSLNAPTPGTMAKATVTGTYDIMFSQRDKKDTTKTETVNLKGSKTINVDVYSLDLKANDTLTFCYNTQPFISSSGYPDGGIYKWEVSGKANILAGTDEATVQLMPTDAGAVLAKVTYSIKDISVTKNVVINIIRPSKLLLADSLWLDSGVTKSITVLPSYKNFSAGNISASSSDNWFKTETANEKLLVTAFSRATKISKLKVSTQFCNSTIEKDITVVTKRPKGFFIRIKGENSICKNSQRTFKAELSQIVAKGKCQWQITGKYSIVGASNRDSVVIKSTDFGNGTLGVTYNAGGENEKSEINLYTQHDSIAPVLTDRSKTNKIDTVKTISGEVNVIYCSSFADGITLNWNASANIGYKSIDRSGCEFVVQNGSTGWVEASLNVCGTLVKKQIPVVSSPFHFKLPAVANMRKNYTKSFVTGFTSGGNFLWTAIGAIKIISGANNQLVSVNSFAPGRGILKCNYSLNGISISDSVLINIVDSVNISLKPDKNNSGQTIEVTSNVPGGVYEWKTNGSTLAPMNFANGEKRLISNIPATGDVITVSYFWEGLSVTKTIQVK